MLSIATEVVLFFVNEVKMRLRKNNSRNGAQRNDGKTHESRERNEVERPDVFY